MMYTKIHLHLHAQPGPGGQSSLGEQFVPYRTFVWPVEIAQ